MVALSRWLPLLPEVITCMAGLSKMPFHTFLLALACGSVPMAFTFAAVGELGADYPALSLCLSAFFPLLFWPIVHYFLLLKERRGRRTG